MSDKGNDRIGGAGAFVSKHRRKFLAAGTVVVLYTLLGFFFVPWLVEKLAVDTVRERYDAELSIDKVAFNPYVLGLRIDGLAMNDPGGDPFASVEQIYVNLQSSSLFRLAATFAEIRLDAPEVRLARAADGALNARFLAEGGEEEPAAEAADSELLRLIVHQFTINEASLHWNDAVPPQPVATTLGPVNVSIQNLNTLPQREGQQDVVITTETTGTLSWNGSLQLNPLLSAGRASIKGSHMPLASAYIRDQFGFEITEGEADVGFDYRVGIAEDGSLEASVENFDFTLSDVLLRTFGARTAAGEPNDRDVLAIPSFAIRDAALRWPEQVITVSEVALTEAALSIHRDAAGVLNVVPRDDGAETAAEPDAAADDSDDNGWAVSLDRLAVDGMSIGLVDETVTPAADMGIRDLTLTMSGISNEAGATFPIEAAIVTRNGGEVRAEGNIGVLPDPVAELSLLAEGLAVAVAHPYLQPLADVNLDSGRLGLDATLSSGPDDALKFSGDISVSDFLITETDEGSRLGSWEQLVFEQVEASLADATIEVSEVRLEKPYADVFVAEDGSVNLGRIEPGEQMPQDDESESDKDTPAEPDPEEAAELPFGITIGRIAVADGAADFADFSLPLPFEAGISELSGELTTIATASSEPSEVTMEGKVDEFGLLRVSGTLTPLEIAKDTDIQLRFQNVEIPKFSAYTVAFAGREIDNGKLDLDLGYALQDGELVGENRIVLREFVLGEKVDHPGAMSLPLGLAVAMLKGPDGTIDIDLPVRGNVDDPEFGYGSVVGKALVNLIVKIVASPFNLLGSLVGSEPEELDHINFIAGRSDLTPPEEERIAKLAEALGLRPELILEVSGVIDRETDGLALRTAKLDDIVEARIETSEDEQSDAMYAEQRAEVVETLYRESGATGDETLEELRARFTTATTDAETGRTEPAFDSLAYTAELRRILIEQQAVSEEELEILASTRADNVRAALAAIDPALDARVRTGGSQDVEAEEDGGIRMEVALAAREE